MSLPTYAGTINAYRVEYDRQLGSQQISPFLIPFDILNYVLLIIYLLFMHKLPGASKAPVFLLIVIASMLSVQNSRTLGLAYGVLIGISSSWCILMSMNLLFFVQPAREFQRKTLCISSLKHSDRSRSPAKDRTQWQSMPVSASRRFFWILDLLGSLRLLHWAYGYHRDRGSSTRSSSCSGGSSGFRRSLGKLLLIYLFIDGLKEIIALDPYFWGYTDSDPPDYIKFYLPGKEIIQAYRMLVAFAVIYAALELVTTFGVLLCVNILGPSLAGTWGNKWAYRPQFGKFDSVFTRGLQGFWGAWWHQMFRFMLTSPAKAMINTLHLHKQDVTARIVGLVVPFLISGVIHAAGSYTMWGDSSPINSFLFFALQPAGIALQITGSRGLCLLGCFSRMPQWIRKAANFGFTAIWLLKTFPLLADDFARGGLWLTELTEPFPFSLLQILGLGSATRSHSLGIDYRLHIQTGCRWWQVGLAV